MKSSSFVSITRAAVDGGWVNTANCLTALRVILAPPIILLLLYKPHLPYNIPYNVFAGLIFVAAASTDKLDGYFARKNNTITKFGQFLDPLADKLLILSVMTTLWYVSLLPLWVLLVVVVRELMVSVIRIIGARQSKAFPASWSGKIKMFFQVVVVSVLIFFPGNYNDLFFSILIYSMAAITVYSGIDYVLRARREVFTGV